MAADGTWHPQIKCSPNYKQGLSRWTTTKTEDWTINSSTFNHTIRWICEKPVAWELSEDKYLHLSLVLMMKLTAGWQGTTHIRSTTTAGCISQSCFSDRGLCQLCCDDSKWNHPAHISVSSSHSPAYQSWASLGFGMGTPGCLLVSSQR